MHPDYLELLRCLNDNKVKYLIIGGYAVIRYAEPRYTKDLDIWIEASTSNGKRTFKALVAFGAPTDNLTAEELSKPGLIYVFGIPPVRVDILTKATGVSFAAAWKSKSVVDVGDGLKAYIVGKKELIKLKVAAGRAQDMADVEKLRATSLHDRSRRKS